jgi:chorismate synthase
MSGNTMGLLFTVTSFGESHGPAIGCVVDGCPPGLAISAEEIQQELDRRKPGTSRHVTQRREPDAVEILSGVYEGKTTGTPIALLIRNTDQRSKDYGNIADTFRPGHADYTYWHKYGVRDPRGGGRSSARETAVRVAAGAIAKKWLHERYGVVIRGHMTQIGEVEIPFQSWDVVNTNPFFAADDSVVPQLEDYMDAIRKSLIPVGARLRVVAENVPVGWGEPVFDRLDADIAYAMMNINAVKGVEIGAGFAAVTQRGSEHGDELDAAGFASNHAGGILGAFPPGRISKCRWPSSPLRPLPSRAVPSTSRVIRTDGNPWPS